ncbi:MAG: hypothetical protein R3293_26650, partial [Candidatus Promineifilaceae bacterium]|nr:hypothetical protein [Candidatus Promineifilaceae bacterium]
MTDSSAPVNKETAASKIPQYGLGTIILMFLWPALWYTFLIYIVGRLFTYSDGTTPTWVMLAIIVLGTGAELAAGLVLLRREGYPLRLSAVRDRIRWQWPKGRRAWLLAVVVFI